jgi:hypothetical protein
VRHRLSPHPGVQEAIATALLMDLSMPVHEALGHDMEPLEPERRPARRLPGRGANGLARALRGALDFAVFGAFQAVD